MAGTSLRQREITAVIAMLWSISSRPEQWSIQRMLIEGNVEDSVAEYPALERIDVDRSFAEMRAAPPLSPAPTS